MILRVYLSNDVDIRIFHFAMILHVSSLSYEVYFTSENQEHPLVFPVDVKAWMKMLIE